MVYIKNVNSPSVTVWNILSGIENCDDVRNRLDTVMNIIIKVPALQNMHASQEYLFHCFNSWSGCYTYLFE